MKKLTLLALLCFFATAAFAQSTTVYVYASGTAGSYTTGSATSSTRTDDSIRSTSTTQNGYAVFNLSSIPASSLITSCTLGFYVSSFTVGVPDLCNTYGYAGDLSTITSSATLFSDITSGTLLFSAMPPAAGSYGGATGHDSMTSTGAPVTSFIQSNIGNKISIGFTGGGTNSYTLIGETGTPSMTGWPTPYQTPYLTITYVPVCAGTPTPGAIHASILSACAATPITLTNTTSYLTGVSFQWQSAPDSTTWTNISGATSSSYTHSGISSTTYFRCQGTCSYSGLSSASAGAKITYLPCCTGTPASTTTGTSTTSCSACSLTLDLPGYTFSAGLTFQWQYSPDNITWSDIYAATTLPFTLAPTCPNYYRCKITCSLTGMTTYSSGAFVAYPLHILADSATHPYPYSCADPAFYAQVNGSSPLLRLKTYYGDGTHDSLALVSDTATSHISTPHTYYTTGSYSIKQVLYYSNTPQDSATFYYTHPQCNTFAINFYLDSNGDCIKESTEPFCAIPLNIKVDSSGISIDTLSVTSGFYYKALGPTGTIYSFSVLSSAINVSCPTTGILYDTVHSTSGTYQAKYIGFSCAGGSAFDLAVADVIQRTDTNGQAGYIYVWNTFCTPKDAVVTLNYSPKYQAEGAYPIPASYGSSSITWNVTALSLPTGTVYLHYNIKTAPGGYHLTLGDTIHTYVTVTPTTGDFDPSNNAMIIIDTVKASHDPNEMSVTPSGCLPTATLTNLQYTINFENTGNDTAHNIYVMDTLSDNVDPRSLTIISASATMNIQVFNDGTHNIVKFDFPSINILDSSHHGQCDGSVIFTVNTRGVLPDGTDIFNRAGIFFDINPVVMTNTVQNTIGCPPLSVNQPAINKVHLYPNPATNELTIKTDKNTYTSFTITNTMGQLLMEQPINTTQTKVNVKTLPPGMYFITLRGDNDTHVEKFVKM